MGALIDYWYYTGDSQWNEIAQQGLLFQVGPNNDYMPPNQTMTEGNDDQGFWGMAVMSAAEYNFPNPPADQPQWLALAQAVFNTQAARWDTTTCGGGLRWQIFQWNNGFDYKNSISLACFFNMAARLALYTGDVTYAAWAYKVWDWMIDIKFMQGSEDDAFYIYDGAHVESGCTDITPYQWTYNTGAFLLGAAAMYNYTAESDPSNNQLWKERVDALVNGANVFFIGPQKDVMTEVACERVNLCDLDQQSFKAYLSRWMAATTKWAPWTYAAVKPKLDASATAAAQQCTGGTNGRMCGLRWANNSGQWDGTTGAGQQMAAMEVILATMIQQLGAPVTGSTGGTSPGNPDAGTQTSVGPKGLSSLAVLKPIDKADIAGAYLLTILVLIALAGGLWMVFHDEASDMTLLERWQEFKKDLGPGGVLSLWPKRPKGGKLEKGKGTEETQTNLMAIQSLDGPVTPPRVSLLSTNTPGPSFIFEVPGTRPSMASSRTDDGHPDEQPWRRPAREGDYAGAIDPKRGNGAGFGSIYQTTNEEDGPSSSKFGSNDASFYADEDPDSLFGTTRGRDLLRKKLKLEKKPLPGHPGLGRREPGQDEGDRKV